MDTDYVFPCEVMWCRYGPRDASSELSRAIKLADQHLSALALAMARRNVN